MGLFTPRYIKEARRLLEGASRVCHLHLDILSAPQRRTLSESLSSLRSGIAARDRGLIEKAASVLETRFQEIIPAKPHRDLAENIEAIFVAVALAVGFSAYFLKPFKIPTGSMQPTLYGMTGHPMERPLPNPLRRAFDFVHLGRTYLSLKAPVHEEVLGLTESTLLNFFTFTDVLTTAGHHRLFAPNNVVGQDFGVRPGRIYEAGETIAHGYVQAGDQVFVDRITYQFRNPSRSDVFVFRTTGIPRIEMNLDPALGSQFYIKRLAGEPGDLLRIDPPKLFLNGSVAQSPPFLRVMSCQNGYRGYSNRSAKHSANGSDLGPPFPYLGSPEETFTVPPHGFFALGDNSYYSSDSRYWGIVPDRNVIGRGFFVYWPFSERWGFIR
jgi:signal peptidase I